MDSVTTISTKIKPVNRIKGPACFLYVEDKGTGGLPVVFAHSFGGNTTHWKNQIEHLQSTRRVIAFDFRGHGKSDLPIDNNYSAEALAKDIAAIADSLGLDRFVLVGHSMGGSAAIAYAGSHSERLSGLVLEGAPGKSPAQQSNQIISALESDDYQKVMDDYMKQLLAGARPAVASEINDGVKRISRENSVRIVKAMFEFDPIPELRKFNGPKLIIATTREVEQPNSLPKLNPEVPRKTIEGTSHWIQLDKPDEFNKALDDFLKSIENELN